MKKILVIMLTMVLCIMPITVNAMNSTENDTEDIYAVEPEGYNDTDVIYHYEIQYGSERLVGLYYLDEYYEYLYNESDVIAGICDANGIQVVSYTYDENRIVSGIYSYQNGAWVVNNDENFVGNRNKMLWVGLFYDEATQCYYTGDRYYNTVTGRYMDGHSDDSVLTDTNPFLSTEDGIMLADYYIEESARAWADSLLSSDNYGDPIDYSTDWHTSLTDVEILARAIYCEGGTAYTNEGDAVARVILNRIHSTDPFYPDFSREVITQAGQFSSITGGTGATSSARNVGKTTDRWENATFLACLMCTTYDEADWDLIVGNPISYQLCFYAYTTAQDGYTAGNCVFSGSGDNMKYGSKGIKQVYVLGYGTVTSFSDLFTNYSTAYPSSRNIYYNYK